MSNQKRFVGIDWGNAEHVACVLDAAGQVLGERSFEHTGDGIGEMCRWLLTTASAETALVQVAIEIPRGAVVETLLEQGFIVYAINPKQLDRFRDRFTLAGAKDDRRDARVLADSLRTDAQAFRALRVDDPSVIELREWTRIADDLQTERTALTNRLHQQLLRYYPQMLELADHLWQESFLSLWGLAPTPAHAARLSEKAVKKLLTEHRISRFDAEHVVTTLRKKPLTVAPGTTEAATAHIASLCERIRLLNRQLKDAYQRLDALTQRVAEETPLGQKSEQRDVEILRSLPGVGRIVLATLLAEAFQLLQRRDYQALRLLAGVGPVTKASGKRSGAHALVGMRRACNGPLREALYHWARVASQRDAKWKAHYSALRARGHSHGRALRGVADRILYVACAMLRDQTEFDTSRRVLAAA